MFSLNYQLFCSGCGCVGSFLRAALVCMGKDHNSLLSCFFWTIAFSSSRSVETIEEGSGRRGVPTALSFPLPDPTRLPIVTTHQEPGTGYLDVKACSKRLLGFHHGIIFSRVLVLLF